MGLDVSIERRVWLGGQYEHNKVWGFAFIMKQGKRVKMDLKKVQSWIEPIGRWRRGQFWDTFGYYYDSDSGGDIYIGENFFEEVEEVIQEWFEAGASDGEYLIREYYTAGELDAPVREKKWDLDELLYTLEIVEKVRDEYGEYYISASW